VPVHPVLVSPIDGQKISIKSPAMTKAKKDSSGINEELGNSSNQSPSITKDVDERYSLRK